HSPPKCEFPHPIVDPIPGSPHAPPPSRTTTLIPLVGESGGAWEKQWAMLQDHKRGRHRLHPKP
ncbi:hypothetical protein A2U01_0094227, partial [Trifolium medium]|nr:hypothetical protein [Trifolium medium]